MTMHGMMNSKISTTVKPEPTAAPIQKPDGIVLVDADHKELSVIDVPRDGKQATIYINGEAWHHVSEDTEGRWMFCKG